jgi:hypothetical protein
MNIDKTKLHHAYIYEGLGNDSIDFVFDFVKKVFGFDYNHPDLFFIKTLSFGVEDAKSIIQKNIQKPTSGSDKVIVVSLNSISHQAQNNLLKVLEEPSLGTYIFIVAPNHSIFLPTIKSRVHILNDLIKIDFRKDGVRSDIETGVDRGIKNDIEDGIKKEANVFVKSDYAKRLEIVKKIMKDKDDEKIDDRYIVSFVSEVASSCGKKSRSLLNVFDFLYDASSSKKMILEYLALMI